MNLSEHWYEGPRYAPYQLLPWQFELGPLLPAMPWKVIDVVPYGYLVLEGRDGAKFKMLNKPVVVEGDIIR